MDSFRYHIARRTREIAIWVALGAMGGEILWMVVRGTLLLVGLGVGIGALVLRGCGSGAGGFPRRGEAFRSHTLCGGGCAVLLAVVAASLPSVLRALRVDPAAQLREQ
jgi:ABC-type antimicrobial peptide transport system permease subunit